MPVELDLRPGRRLPDHVAVTAYYAVSETLANAAMHAHASVVHAETRHAGHSRAAGYPGRRDRRSRPAGGSGLTGFRDRIEALGGTLDLTSPFGHGTKLLIEIPI